MVELRISALPYSPAKSDSCCEIATRKRPRWRARRARSLTHSPVARRSTSFQASSITSTERPANSPASRSWRRSSACRSSLAGDVLGEHEQHRRRDLSGHLAGVEGDQRRVGGHGRRAVEQVGVGALAAERREPLGQGAQLRRHLGRAGLGLWFGAARAARRAAATRAARAARARRGCRRRGWRPRAGCARARRGRRSRRRRGGRRPAARAARPGR